MKQRGRKIVKIEQVVRNPKDYLVKVWHFNKKDRNGYYMKSSESDYEHLPLQDRIRLRDRNSNGCVSCSKEATKQVSLTVKGGGALQLQRYCDSCFDKNIDLEKMRMKV